VVRHFVFITIAALAAAFAASVPPAELTGPVTRSQIMSAVPDWEPIMALYQPKPEAIESLKKAAEPVLIEIYFGSWCSDSKAHVPALFKVLDQADNPLLQASYTAIPRDKANRSRFIPEGRAIDKLPTFIVFLNGREAGRIVETPAHSVEEDLAALVRR
jgi:thiol-disulfide isomerase/thioredoxin